MNLTTVKWGLEFLPTAASSLNMHNKIHLDLRFKDVMVLERIGLNFTQILLANIVRITLGMHKGSEQIIKGRLLSEC